ncbi:hypothetical protein V2J09_007926 [Rumex salicifolius]
MESKAYKLYNPHTKKVVISRDVVFDEKHGWEWTENMETSATPENSESAGSNVPISVLEITTPVNNAIDDATNMNGVVDFSEPQASESDLPMAEVDESSPAATTPLITELGA